MTFIFALIVGIIIYMSLWYLFAVKNSDFSLVDIAYGMAFVVIALSMFFYAPKTALVTTVASMVIVWGLRLSYHIALRKNNKPEDWRYSEMRQNWGKKANQKAYVNIFLLQGFLILIISAPMIVLANYQSDFSVIQFLGLSIWLIGFVFEAIADRQLKTFKNLPNNKGKVMQSGLWRYSRHPNYFGEVLQWWGIWIMVSPLTFGWLAIVSPLTISFLIIFVSGIPLLEKKYKNNVSFQKYAANTSIFFPWFSKKGIR